MCSNYLAIALHRWFKAFLKFQFVCVKRAGQHFLLNIIHMVPNGPNGIADQRQAGA
jgi:hypothetical protein